MYENSCSRIIDVFIRDFKTETNDNALILEDTLRQLGKKVGDAELNGSSVGYRLHLETKVYEINKAIEISELKNLIIQGNNAKIICKTKDMAFKFTGCSNISVNNLCIDYDPLCSTQGTITEVNNDKVSVMIDSGYPNDIEWLSSDYIYSCVHDPQTGSIMEGTGHSYIYNKAEKNEDDSATLTLIYGTVEGARNLKKGDHISLFHRGIGTIRVEKSKSMEFTNVTIYASPGFAYTEEQGEGGSCFQNFRVIPGPKPPGASENRLISANGDATHFTCVKKGPEFYNCEFSACGDDCINIHGFFYHILEVKGNVLTVTPKWDMEMAVGEKVEIYSGDSYVTKGTAKIVSLVKYNDENKKQEILEAYNGMDSVLGDNTLLYDITIDKPLGAKEGDHMTSLDTLGNGAVIRNSVFKNNRARGIVIKGCNILVEHNRFERNTHPAIVIHADIYWSESGFPNNVVIRDNTIIWSGVCANMTMTKDNEQLGAITAVITPKTGVKGFYQNTQIKHLVIKSNVIKGSSVFGIFVANCSGAVIEDNIIINPFMNGVNNAGALYSIKPDSGIFAGMSEDISIRNNIVICNKGVIEAVHVDDTCIGSSIKLENNIVV